MRFGSIFQQCPAECTSTKQSLSKLSQRERKHTKQSPASRPTATQSTCPEKGISIWCRERERERRALLDTAHCSLSATESVSAATKNNQTRLARECRMSTTANWKPIHGSFAALLCFYTGTMARTATEKRVAARENFQINFCLWKKMSTCLLMC